jgi:hypothetical protein
MRQFIYLMLTLFVLSVASVNAQVTIGSTDDPHPGAVLDLKSTTQGVLLPQVPISTGYDFQLQGDAKTAQGMMIYNTGNIPGLYVWNGSQWNTVQTCALPLAPTTITYNLNIANPVASNTLLKITSGRVVDATSYSWTLPDNLEEEGLTSEQTITVRVKGPGTIDLSKLSVRAVNACGRGPAFIASGTLTVEDRVPAVPTFTVSRTTTDPNDFVTLTCGDVGASEYVWTFPEDFAGTSPTTTNTIQLQAPAVVSGINKYPARLFSVLAANELGNSAATVATGDTILVGLCESESVLPVIDTIAAASTPYYSIRYVGFQLTLTATVKTIGTTTYEWNLPKGISITSASSSSSSITIRFDEPGKYLQGVIKLKATNNCGSSVYALINEYLVLDYSDLGSDGEDLIVGNNVYATWNAPEHAKLGTWMVGFSKEGTPGYLGLPDYEEKLPWGYYNIAESPSACPQGWRTPGGIELGLLNTLSRGDISGYLYKKLWASGYGGYVNNSDIVITPTSRVRILPGSPTSSSNMTAVTITGSDTGYTTDVSDYWGLVKCVKM